MILEDLWVYESYIDGKMTKRTRAKEYSELVHTNMYWTFSVHAWGGYGYFITFSYDYSRFGYVHRKSNALDTFFEFKAGLDNLLGIDTKSLRLYQGDMSTKFDFSLEHEIIFQSCAPRSLLQNGEVKRRCQTLMDIMRSLISFLSITRFF